MASELSFGKYPSLASRGIILMTEDKISFTIEDIRRAWTRQTHIQKLMTFCKVTQEEHLIPKIKKMLTDSKFEKHRPELIKLLMEAKYLAEEM